jgi:ribosome maturation factor RimP
MIDKASVDSAVAEAIAGTDIFVVETEILAGGRIVVAIDSPTAMDIDTCAEIARKVETSLSPDIDDYELELGSAGLTAPFKVHGQYLKNIGNEVEVLTRDGRKLTGTLTAATADDFTIETTRKERQPGQKRPVTVVEPLTIAKDNAKTVKYLIKFK